MFLHAAGVALTMTTSYRRTGIDGTTSTDATKHRMVPGSAGCDRARHVIDATQVPPLLAHARFVCVVNRSGKPIKEQLPVGIF
jgi:hypothetical protein